MTKSLQNKIDSFDVSEPYVWKLKLSEADFGELETCLKGASGDLTNEENAVRTIIYVAEWYKRRYQSGNKCELIEGVDWEKLWGNAGISKKRYLYRDENGTNRWIYSVYVMGGLAIKHELNRNDKMKFLKGLCRIYHGENYTLENLDEAARAVAFRESIKRQHSLYEYMKEILNGNMPFDEEDIADEASEVNRFIAAVKTANDEIYRNKFRFEWVVNFAPEYNHINRRLNVWLKPEEVGGGLNQYLRYDRVHLWGVPNAERLQHLYVHIRFKNEEEIVEPATMERPIITYLNHNVNDFVAFGTERGVQVKHIPTKRFNKIEIVVKDDDGNEYIAQRQETQEYLQLWRSEEWSDSWTTTQNSQKQTALLFSNKCRVKNESATDDVYSKRFRDQRFGTSEIWNWKYIYDKITFTDNRGKEINVFNRIGYDQITTKLYSDTIHYIEGGMVRHYSIEDPDVCEDYDIETLPLLFGREDIFVRHFATKDDVLNAQPEEETEAERIEYKQENGRYAEWTNDNEPTYGEVQLRVTIKGRLIPYTVIYLPKLKESCPIERDFAATSIRYRLSDKKETEYKDKIPLDYSPLIPTVKLKYGVAENYYEVEAYRPTLIKEVMFDGKIIEYLEGEEKLKLPYIFKDRVRINDFSESGYQSYDCRNLCSIYKQEYIDIEHNPSIGMAALAVWNRGASYEGQLLDPIAPKSLVVEFGRPKEMSKWEGQEAVLWNYDKDVVPKVTSTEEEPEFGIIFQNLSKNSNLVCNYPIQVDDDPWGFDDVDVSLLRCFEVANEMGTYFFLMKPLIEMDKSDVIKEIYEPLVKARGGALTEREIEGLKRFGEEIGFDWEANGINLENK